MHMVCSIFGVFACIVDVIRCYATCFTRSTFFAFQEASSYKIAARPERRRQFQKELASSVDVAFGLLASCLSFEELREQVLIYSNTVIFLEHAVC
jgi:hypothetical protein